MDTTERDNEARSTDHAQRPFHGPAGPMLERLFAEKGLGSGGWWPFLVQAEGIPLPGGLEALSGFVLAADGSVYGWWLGWASLRDGPRCAASGPDTVSGDGDYMLERWWRVEAPEQAFAMDAEYRLARQRLGLC